MNITLDDTSPLFRYTSKSNGWSTDHTGDPYFNSYFDQTFHGTYADGDQMSLTFNGTAVTVYGAKRSNHGTYSAQLDGGNTAFFSGYNADGQFQTILYQAGGLSPDKQHTIVMTNLPSQTTPPGNATTQWWMDIDYVVIQTAVTGQVYTTTYDDTYPGISYTGASAWTSGPLNPEEYFNRTAAITQHVGNALSMKFNGSAVALYGGLFTDHGNYSIALDGIFMGNYNGSAYQLQAQSVLYATSGLNDGPHQITLTNLGGTKGSFLDFDYAVVNSTINPASTDSNATGSTGATTSTSSSSDTSPASHSSHSNVGAIAGGVVGGLVAAAVLGFAAWFFCFRRRRQMIQEEIREAMDLTGAEIKPYMHGDGTLASEGYAQSQLSYNSPGGYAGQVNGGPALVGSQHTGYGSAPPQLAPLSMMNQSGGFLSAVPPPPASNATSYPHSVNPPSSVGSPVEDPFIPRIPPISSHWTSQAHLMQPQSTGYGGYASVASGSNSGESVPSTGPASAGSAASPTSPSNGQRDSLPSLKSAVVALPYTARHPNSNSISGLSDSTSGPQRMHVPGRERDMGPLPRHPEEEMNGEEEVLPPDYHQATEPFPRQRPV